MVNEHDLNKVQLILGKIGVCLLGVIVLVSILTIAQPVESTNAHDNININITNVTVLDKSVDYGFASDFYTVVFVDERGNLYKDVRRLDSTMYDRVDFGEIYMIGYTEEWFGTDIVGIQGI